MRTWWALALIACAGRNGSDDPPVFDGSGFAVDLVREDVLEGLARPRDLAFDRLALDNLWVVEQGTESVTVARDFYGEREVLRFDDDQTGPHFLARPSGIAFGRNGAMATIHDTDERTQGENGTPPDFMGPTLWTADLVDFDGGHMGHLDMLHNSPLGMGIAWERDNVYWVFDGYHGAITRYDFQGDHGLGGSDHTDGIIARYLEGEVARDPDGTPSHLWFDPDRHELFIVDTGNNRILALDVGSGARGADTSPNYDGCEQYRVDGAAWRVVLDGAEAGMERPSGIDGRDGVIFVSDAGGAVFALTPDGDVLDALELGRPVNGIAFDKGGRLFLVDPVAGVVERIAGD